MKLKRFTFTVPHEPVDYRMFPRRCSASVSVRLAGDEKSMHLTPFMSVSDIRLERLVDFLLGDPRVEAVIVETDEPFLVDAGIQ